MYLSYFGLRVTNLKRSAEFYMRHFGLRLAAGASLPAPGDVSQAAVLLADPVSGQRLELNYYPEGSPYAVPYVPGEALDHVAFRVENLEQFLAKLSSAGIAAAPMKHYDGLMLTTPHYRVAYVRDPDGNQIELFDSAQGDPGRYDRDTF